jgi:hypothetical protein
MSYEFYKVLHVFSILLVYVALGGASYLGGQGAPKGSSQRRFIAITHGVGLTLVLVAGFGLLARLGLAREAFPLWIWGKLALWVVTGAGIALSLRLQNLSKVFAVLFPVLGATAAALAVFKPV